MGDPPSDPPIVVHGLTAGTPPYRRVEIGHVPAGHAYNIGDIIAFAHRVGLEDLDPYDPELVSWHGGGPDDWTL